ncbi:hypothetical protein AC578_6291 [Pseudocercospora eumusae]|uniref:Uncharacterized protein n=1 Tax=Pseudocercospora eumusae TaxID=321146 RepID=A0A139H721_9PEZI|nr:hypothetical protein AC578_6291 [Pseudocercospora eumusae]
MASTRFQSGIDDASKPAGFSSVQQVRSGNGRLDFQRHIDNGAAGASRAWEVGSALDSFVDDRCPTIWGGPGKDPFMPKVRVGRPLDAPISVEATKPIGHLRERPHDGATFFASAIDPGLTNGPRPIEIAGPHLNFPPQNDAAEGATYFASAIDPGMSTGPARAQEDQTRLLVPKKLKRLAERKKADERAEEATRFLSAIDGGTCIRPPAPSALARAADVSNRRVSAIDAGTLAPPDESLLNVPRATGIKPLDGDLLRKLFKHTMNEKLHAEESFKPQLAALPEEANEPSPMGKIYTAPKGFHIPDRQDLREVRDAAKARKEEARRQVKEAQEAARQQAAHSEATEPSKLGSVVSADRIEQVTPKDPTRMIRILAKGGEEAFVPMPNLAPSRPPSTKSESMRAQKAAGTMNPKQPQPTKPDQPKKPNKVQQQIQNNTQKEASGQRAKAAKVASQALMSGALPSREQAKSESGSGHESAQDSGVGFGGMFGEAARPRSLAAIQPTAELKLSSVKHGSMSKVSSVNQTPVKAPAASGWEELGETTYKAATSKPPSQASRAKSAAKSASVAEWLESSTPPVLSPSAGSVKERSPAGWEEVGEGVRRAGSVKNSSSKSSHSAGFRAASVHSFQSIGEGWAHEMDIGKAQSVQSLRQDDTAWPTVVPERQSSKHSSFAARSRAASVPRRQASVQAWPETAPVSTSIASAAIRSRPPSIQSRQVSNRSSLINEDRAPFAEIAPSPVQIKSPTVSHAWTQRDAQDIEPWPQYEEQQQASPSPSKIQLPHSASASQYSRHTEAEPEFQLPSRRTSVVSHRFEQSMHGLSVRSQPRSEQHVGRMSMHSVVGVDEEDFAQRSAAELGLPPMTRNTAHAGRGWITPHPLSPTSSVAGPQSKVVLPSDAHAHGRSLTYDEWKEMQERGMRLNRNISITESSKTRNGIYQDERYHHPGWEGGGWEDVEPSEAASERHGQDERYQHPGWEGGGWEAAKPEEAVSHSERPRNYHSPTVRSEASERSVVHSGSGLPSGRRSGYVQTIQEPHEPFIHPSEREWGEDDQEPSIHPSERQWEEMEEGVAGFAMPRNHVSGSAGREELQQYINSRPASMAGSFRSGRW